MKIAIAGATGFIGKELIHSLLNHTEYQILALSRRPLKSAHSRLEVKVCDLYSLLDTENALSGCDVVIYLVHSMSPSSRLSQGSFRNFDYLLADNFARAARKNSVQHIIYISGLIPSSSELSKHLLSRLEVEKTLMDSGVPTTSLRCGIIIGPQGSSFQIIERLTERLPVLLMPKWMMNKTQAVYVGDIIKVIENCIRAGAKSAGAFEVGMKKTVTYYELVKKVSEIKKTNNTFISIPWIPFFLSKPWVTFVSGVSYDLISPLVDSLKHNMLVSQDHLLPSFIATEETPLDQALQRSVSAKAPELPLIKERSLSRTEDSLVQSVQRLPLPASMSVEDAARIYMSWLQKFLWPFLKVLQEGQDYKIFIGILPKPLLILSFSESRTFEGRPLYYITGGWLAKPHPKARLEFRHCIQSSRLIVAIHNYKPSLPWYLYRYTQAVFHYFIMRSFGRYLKQRALKDL